MSDLAGAGAVRYRLSATAGRYRWTVDGEEVASAVWRDHCWDLRDPSDAALLSVVGGPPGGRARVALVDHRARRVCTFALGEPVTRANIGVVADSYGEPLMLVRADGPTGLHVVDADGEVLAVTSRHRDSAGRGCEVLLTEAGAKHGLDLLLGVLLAIELLRTGALRFAAPG